MERAIVFCRDGLVDVKHLPEKLQTYNPKANMAKDSKEQSEHSIKLVDEKEPLPTLAELDRRYLRYVLDKVNGNKKRAAALLGIGRKTLYRYLATEEANSP